MTSILKISKHKLDICQVELNAPSLLIGRSPSCDQVLRAPGIMPIHFLLEWVGEGEFDSKNGFWTLFDLSKLISEDEEIDSVAGEGHVLSKQFSYQGFTWEIGKDRIYSPEINSGVISDQILSARNKVDENKNQLALEVVILDRRDRKVVDIVHFFDGNINLDEASVVAPFEINWHQNDNAKLRFIKSLLKV